MAAPKQITVVINGEEHVTGVAEKATEATESFGSKAIGVMKGLAAAAIAFAVGGFFKKAIEEAQTSREAMGQLELAVNNSGASFKKMQPEIEGTIDKLARFSKFGDDDLAAALQNMVLKTGDAAWSTKNLGQAADLAAASGVDLEQASTVLAQAHEGNTKALFRLIPELKGASNWQEMLAAKTDGAAEAQMRQLGPIAAIQKQFGEFAESVGKAILGAGGFEEAGFGVADMLGKLANWIDANTASITPFVDAIVDVGKSLLEALTPVWTILKTVGAPILKLVVFVLTEMGFALRAGTIFWEECAGKVLQVVGTIYEKGGKLLKAFGINVVEGFGKSMRELGERMDAEASARWGKLEIDQKAFIVKMRTGGQQMVRDVETHEEQKISAVKKSLQSQEEDFGKHMKAVEQTYKMLAGMAVEYRRVLDTLNPAIKASLDKQHAEEFGKAWNVIDANARTLIDRMKKDPLPPLIKPATEEVGKMGEKLSEAAHGVLDVADNFGGLDDESKAVLTNIVSIGDTVKTMLSGGLSFAGISGIMGAVGAIVSAVTSDAREYKQLQRESQQRLKENSVEVAKLSKQYGLMNLDVAGGEVATIEQMLSTLVPKLAKGGSITDFFGLIKDATSGLVGAGLGWDSVVALAKKFGMNILDRNGGIDFAQLPELLKMLQGTNTAAPGTDWASQLGMLTAGFNVNGTDALGQAGMLAELAGKFSPSLRGLFRGDSLAGSRAALQSLFNRMAAGQLSEAELGGLSGNQYREFLLDLIARIDDIVKASAPPDGVDTGVPGVGTITLPPSVVSDTQGAAASSATALLATANAFHQRIADATERSLDRLVSIDDKMTVLIDVTTNNIPRIDAQLENAARQAALQVGRLPTLR